MNEDISKQINSKVIKSILNNHINNNLPSEDDFRELTAHFYKICPDNKLTYDELVKYKSACSYIYKNYLSSSLYLSSYRFLTGEVDLNDFLRKVQRKIDVDRTIAELKLFVNNFDDNNISERQLSLYIHSLISQISLLQTIPKEFIPYYMIASARKFFFFINNYKNNFNIKITKLVNCNVMEELWFLRRLDKQRNDIDSVLLDNQLQSNWFYYKNIMEIYCQFLELDQESKGTLNANELHSYKGTTNGLMHFTIAACQRIIEAHMDKTNCKELDFIGFINLILACENKTSLSSLNYFWKVLNMNDNNILSSDIIRYFYNNLCINHRGMPNVDIIINEIFDLLGCNDSNGPTYEQYIKSGKGYIVASILLDIDCFFIYENRESNY